MCLLKPVGGRPGLPGNAKKGAAAATVVAGFKTGCLLTHVNYSENVLWGIWMGGLVTQVVLRTDSTELLRSITYLCIFEAELISKYELELHMAHSQTGVDGKLVCTFILWLCHYAKKATVQQVTTMQATTKNVLFPGHNHRCWWPDTLIIDWAPPRVIKCRVISTGG